MPVVQSEFKGSTFYRNGHLETILPALLRNVHVAYTRERVWLRDQDFVDLDWVKQGHDKLIVLIHGLEGSSQSQYIKGFARYFSTHGFDVCAFNLRGCSGEANLKLRSYHSGATEDLEDVLGHINASNNYKQLSLVGFSLGGNLALKYLGENKANVHLHSAVIFSAPVDLGACAIEMSLPHNRIYLLRFLKSLRKKMQHKAALFPSQVDVKRIKTANTFYQFDDAFTAPIHGFQSADDYYQKCSSKNLLKDIQIPTLLINAQNDPFLPPACYPVQAAEQSPCLFLEVPSHGGHVGFSVGLPNSLYWSEFRAMTFINRNSFH